jgi:DNA-binding SARP family transcriptional activator
VDDLRIRLLGGLEVEGLALADLGSRKARTLLKMLALAEGAVVPADRLVEALWPSGLPGRPVDQVGVLVSRLRSVIGAERIRRTDAGWSLDLDWLDVGELADRVDEASARLAAGQPQGARVAARAALAIVRGELLIDEPDATWADAERARTARLVAQAGLVGAEAALAMGDPLDAAAMGERVLDHDPYDEAALRVVMRAHVAAGRPASALAAYARARQRMGDDLGVDPSAETEAVHTAILREELRPEPVPPPRPELVGRSGELATLDRFLAAAAAGRALLVAVEGEAGIGKTSLVSAWAASRGAQALVISGRCDELGRDLPLQPLLDGLARYLHGLDAATTDAVLGDAASVLGPLLGRFASTSARALPTTVTDAAAGQALLFASLLGAIERAAAGLPAVVIVDDVHLGGDSTIEWLRFAVRRGSRLLVLATCRPGGPPLRASARLDVGPLDLAAVTELVGAGRAPELLARSGGHPLFLLELANTPGDDLPATIRDAVAGRLDGLGPSVATLRTAAILGGDVDVDLLAAVLDLPVTTLLEHLDEGVQALILEDQGATVVFRHELVREALAADTTVARRAAVHRSAARLLRGRPGHDPMLVAWHASVGGDAQTAASSLVDAAALAGARHDVRVAHDLLTDAIALADSVAARLARARLRIAIWDPEGAEADVASALDAGAGAPGLEVAAWVAYYRRDYERAQRLAEEAVARSDDDGLRTSCLAMSGRVLHASGDLAGADDRLTAAARDAPAAVRGVAQAWLGGLRVHQGRTDEGEALVERALVGRDWLGHPFVAHHGYMFRALALGQQGQIPAAFDAVEAFHRYAVAAGEQGERFTVAADNIRSWLLRGVGRLSEAAAVTASALDRAGSAEAGGAMSEPRAAALLDGFDSALLAGDLVAADAARSSALALRAATGTMMWHHRQRYGVLCARLALRTGAADEAVGLARAVREDAELRGSPRYGALAIALEATAAAVGGQPVDHAAVDRALHDLDRCAALEAWRATAELAAATRVDRWWRDAERRVDALVARADGHGSTLARHAAATLSQLPR